MVLRATGRGVSEGNFDGGMVRGHRMEGGFPDLVSTRDILERIGGGGEPEALTGGSS